MREIVNTAEQLTLAVQRRFITKERAIAILYQVSDRISGSSSSWRVYSPFFETDPNGAWYNRGMKTFVIVGDARVRRPIVFEEARAWAKRYRVTEWARNSFGDYVPKVVNDNCPIPKRKKGEGDGVQDQRKTTSEAHRGGGGRKGQSLDRPGCGGSSRHSRSPQHVSDVGCRRADRETSGGRMASSSPLTFEEVSRISRERAFDWYGADLDRWTVADWTVAMVGEAGEVANAVKKLRRLVDEIPSAKGPKTNEEAIRAIALEIGDTYLYLDLLAQRLGIKIEDAVRDTFNRVSEREGLKQRI